MSITEAIILYCALALIATSGLFLVTILLSRLQKTAEAREYENVKDSFQKRLNSFLIVGDVNDEKVNPFSWRYFLEDFRQQLSRNFQKQLLIDLLMSNKQNLSGYSGDRIRKVYIRLQLKAFSRSKLTKRNAYKKISGLKELAEMGCEDALPEIHRLFRGRNPMVRAESFIAMVRLGGAGSLDLVRGYNRPVPLWIQVRMQKHLSTVSRDRVPKFQYWLSSSNADLKKFAIKMTCHFKQLESLPRLAIMLRDKDVEIAGLAAWALGEMGAGQHAFAIEKLGKLHMLDERLSLSVIQALGHLGKPLDHKLYLSWHMIHGSAQVRMESMRNMHKLKINCRDLLIDFNLNNDHEFESIYSHIMEPLLK